MRFQPIIASHHSTADAWFSCFSYIIPTGFSLRVIFLFWRFSRCFLPCFRMLHICLIYVSCFRSVPPGRRFHSFGLFLVYTCVRCHICILDFCLIDILIRSRSFSQHVPPAGSTIFVFLWWWVRCYVCIHADFCMIYVDRFRNVLLRRRFYPFRSLVSIYTIYSRHTIRTMKWKNVSCEIEDFVETHLCKLRGILQSRVLRVLCNLIKAFISSLLRGTKSDSCGTQWMYEWICD